MHLTLNARLDVWVTKRYWLHKGQEIKMAVPTTEPDVDMNEAVLHDTDVIGYLSFLHYSSLVPLLVAICQKPWNDIIMIPDPNSFTVGPRATNPTTCFGDMVRWKMVRTLAFSKISFALSIIARNDREYMSFSIDSDLILHPVFDRSSRASLAYK